MKSSTFDLGLSGYFANTCLHRAFTVALCTIECLLISQRYSIMHTRWYFVVRCKISAKVLRGNQVCFEIPKTLCIYNVCSLNTSDWKFNLFICKNNLFLRLFSLTKHFRLKISRTRDWKKNQSRRVTFQSIFNRSSIQRSLFLACYCRTREVWAIWLA